MAMQAVMLSSETTDGSEWTWDKFWGTIIEWLSTHGLRLLIGLVVLFVCFFIINLIARAVRKSMIKHGRDKTITSVVYQIIKKGIKIVLIVIFLGYVGIDTAGIGAIIGAIGVAIGLAAQGALSNFAGGMIILVMRPFKVGDYVETDGESGTVEDIHMFYTYIATDNNQLVMIPNGEITSGAVINYSAKPTRRLDLKFSISYNEDFEYAEDVIYDICDKHPKVLDDPEPMVRINEHGDSAIVLLCRVWTKTEDYWDTRYDLLEEVKRRFDEEQIEIPYPQMDVHTPSPAPRRTREKLDTRKRRKKLVVPDAVISAEPKPDDEEKHGLFGRRRRAKDKIREVMREDRVDNISDAVREDEKASDDGEKSRE